ncbi:MAG: biopolymer transporter ExbD [Rhodopirellula sp.]|nr:biopolymer transporter ExbD [Rhodopirellula sp.]
MRTPQTRSRASVGFNMTPMIDVVFLLIIFFLVSSHLAQQETQLELDLPDAASGERPIDDDIRRVVVNVLPDDGPAPRIQVGSRLVPPEDLDRLIGFESQQTDGKIEVRIRADRHVPYRVVEPIMIACARAGVWKVTFAVVAGG